MARAIIDLVNVLILDSNNHALLVHNCKEYKDSKNDLWVFPGGKIKEGEKPEQAAIREAKEETGICIKIIRRQGSRILGDYETSTPEGNFLCRTYHARIINGEAQIIEPQVDNLGYFSYTRLLRMNEEGILTLNIMLALPRLKEFVE
jgi:8-oxo-dGTP pyrophosphatase MutT (NUDIX family)